MSWEADFNDARNELTRLRAQLAAAEREHGAASAALSEAVATNEHLRAQLAAVEKERDAIIYDSTAEMVAARVGRDALRGERDAALARVKALEAALEPTALGEEIDLWLRIGESESWIELAGAAVAAIRARAGLTKEGT